MNCLTDSKHVSFVAATQPKKDDSISGYFVGVHHKVRHELLVAFDLLIRQSIAIPAWPIHNAEWSDQDQPGKTRTAQILFFLCNSELTEG